MTAKGGGPIFILATGQSNFVQTALAPLSPAAPNAFIWNNDNSTTPGTNGSAFVALSTVSWGTPAKILYDVANTYPARNVYLLNCATGSEPIAQWMTGAASPDVYQFILDNITLAMTAAGVTKINGFFWWQGENQTATPWTYFDDFNTVMARFQAQTWFPRGTPTIIFGLMPESYTANALQQKTDQTTSRLQQAAQFEPETRRFINLGLIPASMWDTTLHLLGPGVQVAGALGADAFLHGADDKLLDPLTHVLRPQVLGRPASRNLIKGGDFTANTWKKGTTFTAAADGTETADGFLYLKPVGVGVVDIKKTADAPTTAQAGMYTQHCLHVDVTTADTDLTTGTDYYGISQRIDGADVGFLGFGQAGARPLTISFWVKSTVTGVFFFSIGNSALDRCYCTQYTVTTTNTWEKKIIVIPPDVTGTWLNTLGTIGLRCYWTIASGDTYLFTPDVWGAGDVRVGVALASRANGMSSTSNDFKLALVQIEEGKGVSAFDRLPGGLIDVSNYVTNARYPNLRYILVGVNANAVADSPITITLPNGATRFRVANIGLINTGATASLTAAQYGIFSAAGGGGTAYVAAGAVLTGLTATGLSAAGAFANATNVGATIMFPSGTQFFFRITTGQGAAATIDVIFVIEPFP